MMDGGFGCLFNHKGQDYIATLIIQIAYADFCGPECIIFKAVDKQITFENALGICSARNCEYSADAVREIVEDFIQYS